MRPLCISYEDLCLRLARKVRRDCKASLNHEQCSNFALWLAMRRNVAVVWRNCRFCVSIYSWQENKDLPLSKENFVQFFNEYREDFPEFNYPNEKELSNVFRKH